MFHTTDAYAPFNISLDNHHHFPPPQHKIRRKGGKKRIKEPVTYCLDDRPSVIASKETCLFVSTLTLPTCALSGQTQCPAMTQDSRCILIQPFIHLCSPQTSQKWQPASLCRCMATSAAYLCSCLCCCGPWWPVRCRGERCYRAFTL